MSSFNTNKGWYYRLKGDRSYSQVILEEGVTFDLGGYTLSKIGKDHTIKVVGNNVTITNGVLDGEGTAKSLIYAKGVSNLNIFGVTVRNTTTSPSNSSRGNGIVLRECKESSIVDSEIHNISWPTTSTEEDFIGRGIYTQNCQGLVIANNHVHDTLNAGIDFTGSVNCRVFNNKIERTARKKEVIPDTGATGDSITAYHNMVGGKLNYVIYGNTMDESNNHGIHVSGESIRIGHNDIKNVWNDGIRIGDQREPRELSKDVHIYQNKVVGGTARDMAVYAHDFAPRTIIARREFNDITGKIMPEEIA